VAANPINLVVILLLAAMLPFVVLMVTSYTKLAVVFSLLRSALGIQQVPPNMVLYGISLILTVYIMSPVGHATFDLVKDESIDKADVKKIFEIVGKAKEPLKAFLAKHAREKDRRFFAKTIKKLWPERDADYGTDEIIVLIPAFMLSELTAAFEIGFVLYLPFVAIDLIVSNVLMALGMIMMSPLVISLPFKLLLFVMLDGWGRIVHSLVLSYV
jgi:type III secretion protein R